MSNAPDPAKTIFLNALEIASPEAREAYLEKECGDNSELRAEVEELLKHHRQMNEPEMLAGTTAYSTERPGAIVGSYKLMEQIGEGGMGLVFVAEQLQPVRRKVALKIIKPGMDTRDVIARFEAERQALALLDHPNIARVFDAGATESGRPYFVMELVQGVPITQYCDENRLSPRERLELFRDVCHAVQHAHQKGIMHRDIKPSNVLVTAHDGKPTIKVIDFGLAKAVGQQLTERTIYTGLWQMLGTPLYMSPEQAGMGSLDIDTRTDIYSLGVLLYELLTGTTPFDKDRFKQVAYDEMRRIIREEDPPKPSTRISTADTAPSIAASRHTEPARLAKLVRGDLDWIAMKALEKDRSRRYETASSLAEDVRRYLADEEVQACPPSVAYRTRKFMRRHARSVMAALLLGMALIAGLIGTSTGYFQAVQARKQAELARADAQQARDAERLRADSEARANREAVRERDRAVEAEANTRVFSRFLVEDVLAAARPAGVQGGQGIDVTMVEALRRAEPKIADEFHGQPQAEALARHAIGVTWRNLGLYDDAEKQLRRAIDLLEPTVPESDPLLREIRNSLAVTLFQVKRYDESLPLMRQVLTQIEAEFGPRDRATLRARMHVAGVFLQQNRIDDAKQLYEGILEDQRQHLPQNDIDTLETETNLASVYMHQRDFERAYELYNAILPNLPADDPSGLACKGNLALVCTILGKHDRALELSREAVLGFYRILGPKHPQSRQSLRQLGLTYGQAKKPDKLNTVLDELVAWTEKKYGTKSDEYNFVTNETSTLRKPMQRSEDVSE